MAKRSRLSSAIHRPQKLTTRPPVKRSRIAADLRRQIVTGKLSPGDQLPTRPSLEKIYSVSQPTIQQAINQLTDEGFVFARGGHGTFVADHPPHLSRYVVVMPGGASQGDYESRFLTAFANEAHALDGQQPGSVVVCRNAGVGTRELEDLLSDLEHDRVAGLIFPQGIVPLKGNPLLDMEGVPKVGVMQGGTEQIMAVFPDLDDWYVRAFDCLAEKGRRRVALLTTWMEHDEPLMTRLKSMAAERGIETRPYWVQQVAASDSPWAVNAVHLLFNAEQSIRPDAFVITDDNIVEHSLAGLVQAGVRVPDDVEVVAHCNFPWQPTAVLPIHRLGFDVRKMLLTCIGLINAAREGRDVDPKVLIPAQFESELVESLQQSRSNVGSMFG